ncbi:MAG: hypothetical protein OXR07_08395 [Nitrospira sp.]|nr:hypothetical protein [Nitrospira sp.]
MVSPYFRAGVPVSPAVMPALPSVIPAHAGIQSALVSRIFGLVFPSLPPSCLPFLLSFLRTQESSLHWSPVFSGWCSRLSRRHACPSFCHSCARRNPVCTGLPYFRAGVPVSPAVMPALPSVIPAHAGIQAVEGHQWEHDEAFSRNP